MRTPSVLVGAALSLAAFAVAAEPAPLVPREGWVIASTRQSFDVLSARLDGAIAAKGMNLVNSASASAGAKAQGITIPGNRVVGVFRNDFARRMLAASLPAGIEAPVRFYLVENADATATLSWRKPSVVFAPYYAQVGSDLRTLADELDSIFAVIAAEATRP
jgi:uncharacterized protein (DUF302 family)